MGINQDYKWSWLKHIYYVRQPIKFNGHKIEEDDNNDDDDYDSDCDDNEMIDLYYIILFTSLLVYLDGAKEIPIPFFLRGEKSLLLGRMVLFIIIVVLFLRLLLQ